MQSSGSERATLDDLYRAVILQHYQSPSHRRPVDEADVRGFSQNPLCGDEMTVGAWIRDGRVAEAGFQARGCSISQASADMMIDAVGGRSLEEVSALIGQFRAMMAGGAEEPSTDLGDLAVLQGVRRFPVRVKCALLPWNTLESALATAKA